MRGEQSATHLHLTLTHISPVVRAHTARIEPRAGLSPSPSPRHTNTQTKTEGITILYGGRGGGYFCLGSENTEQRPSMATPQVRARTHAHTPIPSSRRENMTYLSLYPFVCENKQSAMLNQALFTSSLYQCMF